MAFPERTCKWPECTKTFIPSGSRQKYCDEHKQSHLRYAKPAKKDPKKPTTAPNSPTPRQATKILADLKAGLKDETMQAIEALLFMGFEIVARKGGSTVTFKQE